MRKPNKSLYVVALCMFSMRCGELRSPAGSVATELLTDNRDAFAQAVSSCFCTQANGGLWATFQVGPETFKQKITNPPAIVDAIAVWRGQSNKTIPVGSLRCSCAGWNCAWGFAMDPATLMMAPAAIEICDGLPSHVNEVCPHFGGGYYCPALAVMTDLRDCRSNPACPVVPR